MPSVASGLFAPKVILQDVEPVAAKVHRPAKFTGGGLAAGPAGAGLAAGALSDPPPNVMRSPPLQAASSNAQTTAGREATRKAMANDTQNCERSLWLADC
ncbi:MAG: hypothetical protein WA650_16405 [Bradyrhizobium sp.]